MDSSNKLFLLDAYALIYRAYYAFIKNPRINSKGFNTSAILGFVNTLEEVLKKENPTHIGVAFDPAGPTFRHEAFEQYKAQREETPEAIRLNSGSDPPFRTYYKGYYSCLPHPYSGSCRLRSRRRDRYARHRSRSSGYHHLYDDSRQRLRAVGKRQGIYVPSQAHRRFRSDGC